MLESGLMSTGIWSRGREFPSHIAVIDETGCELTAARVAGISNRIANRLVALGLERGDVVAAHLPSGMDLLAFALATRQVGLYLLPLNPRASIPELQHLIQDGDPRLLILGSGCTRPEFTDLVPKEAGVITEWVREGGEIEARLTDFLQDTPDTAPVARTAGDTLTYTSGTTGIPKAVLRKMVDVSPEVAIKPALDWYSRSFGINQELPGAFLGACPLHFSGPLSFASYSLHLGRTLVLMPQWNARLALALISRHGVSETFLVPYQLMELVDEYQKNPARYDITSLRSIIHGSAPCPLALKDRAMDTFGEVLYESYGSTEVAGAVATPGDARIHRGTVGRAIAPHELKILNEHGQPCRVGETGRVFMRMLPGTEFLYKGDPAATASCQAGGFATAGDLGFLNESGYLFLQGRSSEAINCRGEKVHPVIVENAAMRHPQVVDAAAFGASCAQHGEAVHLAVRLLPSEKTIQELVAEILGSLSGSLARAYVPTSVFVVREIPRGLSGKLRRKEVAELVRRAAVLEVSGRQA